MEIIEKQKGENVVLGLILLNQAMISSSAPIILSCV
jgi:hypothetical protein